MASRDPKLDAVQDKENAAPRLLAQQAGIKRPIKRGALGELGNKTHNLQNDSRKPEKDAQNLPQAALKKNLEVTRQGADIKGRNLKTEKENRTVVENTKDDPRMVTEYDEDNIEYVKTIEVDFPLREKLLEGTKITSEMRSKLVNWLADVQQDFDMEIDSLHLAVSILDRYLQVNRAATRGNYQLIGTASLVLACKHEEGNICELEEFVYLGDNAFTKEELLHMEMDIVKKLDFRMGWPVSVYFLRRYSKIAALQPEEHTLAEYILELALVEYDLIHIRPSVQAAAACCLSIALVKEVSDPAQVWKRALTRYIKYKYSDIKNVIYRFAEIVSEAETACFSVIREKYSVPSLVKSDLLKNLCS